MPDQGREAMSDIISAKCFGCGHVVKVPSALGGKKARCPKCTNTIVIPALAETSDEIVTDDQLPEVARDDEVLEGEFIESEDAPETSFRPPSESRRERPGSGSHRRAGGKDPRGAGRVPAGRAPKSSNTGLVVAVIVGLLVLVGAVVAIAMKPGKTEPSPRAKKAEPGPSNPTPDTARTAEDDALEARCRDYVAAFNRGNVAQVARFYEPEPGRDLTQAVGRLMGGNPRYKGPEFTRSSAAEGLTVFVCEYSAQEGAPPVGKEVSLRWKKIDNEWFIADRPQ